MDHKVFVGYAQTPDDVSHEVRSAADIIQKSGVADTVTWEATPAQGRLIIETILSQIDKSSVCLFDITTLSQNVLFEVGYAFSKRKHVLLSLSTSKGMAQQNWKSLDIFSTAGCLFYETGTELANKFMTGFDVAGEKTLWDDIAKSLEVQNKNSLFYAPAFQTSEADRNLRRLVNAERETGTRVRMADPGEQGSAPLAWYVNAVYSSAATLLQMTAHRGNRGVVSNARSAFLAGMAKGLERPLLIVVEEEYDGPVDYKDLLYVYHNKKRLKEHFNYWLATALRTAPRGDDGNPGSITVAPRLELATELKHLKFGEYVAEDESDALDEYFVRTSEYEAVLTENSVAFVGRKGVGKSANMIRASQELREDKRNLVCVVQPNTYELEGLVGILKSIDADGSQDFLVESFWKFLLYSEIAITAVNAAEKMPAGVVAGTPMAQLRDYLAQNSIEEDFSIRLERVVQDALTKLPQASKSIEERRRNIVQTLHGSFVSNLRRLLGEALSDRNRVAILVDNLDTAWRKNGQLRSLGILLLGLLGAASKVSDEFKRQGNKLSRVNVTMAVFLRSDIFDEVIKEAREPDKVNTRRIDWSQRILLTRVMDERYLAVRSEGTSPSELWERYFCADVNGRSTREYILDRILPRPRDFVFFCKAAVFHAVNARHDQVDISDIREAERDYSKFALDALLVEYGASVTHLEDVLYEFVGENSVISKENALATIGSTAGIGREESVEILDKLISISFFGIEVREGEFTYPERGPDLRKAKVLARRISKGSSKEERLQIHPAYRNFLDVQEAEG